MYRKIFFIGIMLLLSMGSVFADAPVGINFEKTSPITGSGFYFGGQGQAIVVPELLPAGGITAGYQFNKYFAVQASTINLVGVNLLAKVMYPVNDRANVYVRGGGITDFRQDVIPTAGAGISFALSDHLVGELGVDQNFLGTDFMVTSAILGVTYHF